MTKTTEPAITDVTGNAHDGFRVTMTDGETTRYYGPEAGDRDAVELSALAHWNRREDQLADDASNNTNSEPSTGGFARRR